MKLSIPFVLVIILFFIFCIPSEAQINKGQVLLGGSTGFSTVSLKTITGTNYSNPGTKTEKILELTPEIGIFVANNLALGIAVEFKNDELNDGNKTYTASSLITIPFIREYFGKEKLKPFVYGGIGFGKSNGSQTGYGTSWENIDKNLSMYEIGGGLAFFINSNVSLEFGVAYSHVVSKYKNSNNVQMEDTGKGTGFTVGINLCL